MKGEDAIGRLGAELERFLLHLRNNLSTFSQSAELLACTSEELSSVGRQMSSNAEETEEQSRLVAVAATDISRNLQTVATGSEEMAASIREISKNISSSWSTGLRFNHQRFAPRGAAFLRGGLYR